MISQTVRSRGFTIVELLIVIVVIAILAAITIVTFSGLQNRANASAAGADASQAKRQLMAYQAENGQFPPSGSEASAGIGSS